MLYIFSRAVINLTTNNDILRCIANGNTGKHMYFENKNKYIHRVMPNCATAQPNDTIYETVR